MFPDFVCPEINKQKKLERKAKQILVDRGYFETFSYPLSSEEKRKGVGCFSFRAGQDAHQSDIGRRNKDEIEFVASSLRCCFFEYKGIFSFSFF